LALPVVPLPPRRPVGARAAMGCLFSGANAEAPEGAGTAAARLLYSDGALLSNAASEVLAAPPAPCMHGCGLAAFRTRPTCCSHCRGPEGPHARDCHFKNQRLRPACHRDCGRPARKSLTTCCARCEGPGGPHADTCAEGCRRSVGLLPEGSGGQEAAAAHVPPVRSVTGSLQHCCEHCRTGFSVAVPAAATPGAQLRADCPQCNATAALRLPGARPAVAVAPPPSGRRRALLVGINYFGDDDELRGCVNDVDNLERLLTDTLRWPAGATRRLTDNAPAAMPTRRNIEAGLHWLAKGARPGDVLVFSFSGHGGQVEDPHGYEEDGMNETILPMDYKTAGMITDDEISDLIVKPLPEGVRLTAIMDCCHSGTGLDLPYLHTGSSWKEEVNPYHSPGDVQLFSGCEDNQESADFTTKSGRSCGAMTSAFCDVLRANRSLTYTELMHRLAEVMRKRGFTQHPQLTSTQRFGVDRPFLLADIVPNSNERLGRTCRRRFPSRPRDGVLAEVELGAAVANSVLQEALQRLGRTLHQLCCGGGIF